MSTRTNIVLDDDLVAQAMILARVTTKKAAVEAALRAYVRKPDYSGILALRGKGLIDPDYDPKGHCGLTQEALVRRGLLTFEDVRTAHENQLDDFHKKTSKPAKPRDSKISVNKPGVTQKRPALDAA